MENSGKTAPFFFFLFITQNKRKIKKLNFPHLKHPTKKIKTSHNKNHQMKAFFAQHTKNTEFI